MSVPVNKKSADEDGDEQDGDDGDEDGFGPASGELDGFHAARRRFRDTFGGDGIFGEHAVLVHAQVAANGANKAAVKGGAGEGLPLFGFQGFEIARADARCDGDFVERDAAHFALPLQALAKTGGGHPVGWKLRRKI